MKGIMRAIPLVAVLCLAGCSSEDPQSVEILTEDASITAAGGTVSLSIEANCPWTVTEQSDLVTVTQPTGSGNATVRIQVGRNTAYDNVTHTVTVTSEDGSSRDTFTITQEQDYTVQAGDTGMISCEGGTFSVPVNTNDNINKVETPDWITFTGSRSLTGYTYTFEAQPNKTGAVRQGTVRLAGASSNGEIPVKQDSYAPESVEIELPGMAELAQSPVSVPVSVSPDYADMSKLEVNAEGCSAVLKDNTLEISFSEAGESTVTVLSSGKAIYQASMTVVEGFDANSVKVSIPDSLAVCQNAYTYEVKPEPDYADMDRITAEASGGEASFKDGTLSLLVNEEGTCTVRILSSGTEIFTKDIVVYDASYPTSVEIDFPEVLCEGRHAYKIHVFPETSDASKLKVMNVIHGVDFSIKGDSIYVDIKPDHFRPILSIFSNGKNVFYKDFDVISDSAGFNLNNSDVFAVEEVIQIEADIPLKYADFWISDPSVLEEMEHGKFKVKGEGSCTIELTNKISGTSHSVFIIGKQIHMYAKILNMGPELFDTYRIVEVSLKGFNLGPGEFIFESGASRIPVIEISEDTDFANFKKIEIKDIIPQFSDKETYKKYKLTYIGYINGRYTTYVTEGEF